MWFCGLEVNVNAAVVTKRRHTLTAESLLTSCCNIRHDKLTFPPRRRRLPASALMQFAKDSRDLLMLAPCRSCSPRLFVADARSELKKTRNTPKGNNKR